MVRTVLDARFKLSDQRYMHLDVSAIDTQSPTCDISVFLIKF